MVGGGERGGSCQSIKPSQPPLPITTHQRAFCTGRSKALAEEKLKDFAVVILGQRCLDINDS